MSTKDQVYAMRQKMGKPDPLTKTSRTPTGDPLKDAIISRVDADMAARGIIGGDNVLLDDDVKAR